MATLIITYDLNKETKRPDIVASIRAYGNWAKLSESSYAIQTNSSPKQVYDSLLEHLDGNDNCYVVSIGCPFFGQGPNDVNEWLRKNLTGQFVG